MGYVRLKVIHPKEENNEKQDKQEAREDRGQRIEDRCFEAIPASNDSWKNPEVEKAIKNGGDRNVHIQR
jgi:hypothetical protein